LYEQYLDENNLSDNDILKLFLAEIRYYQLAYKITDNTARMKVEKMVVPKNRLNETISKWYHESKVYEYVSMSSVNKSLEMKLKQNALERQRSIDEADNFIVK
jgi:adenine C2-methylase RlmN of 23S rRNA A2503 and tRNA A37